MMAVLKVVLKVAPLVHPSVAKMAAWRVVMSVVM